MKQIVKFILVLISVVFSTTDGIGQIPGKIYQLGDTIILDGITCLVYKVDETGMHGTAMSPNAKSTKELEKMKKKALKRFEKEIKKGNATPEDMNTWLSEFRYQELIPVIAFENGKRGRTYRVDEWSKQIPQGWRIPSTRDAEDFATFYCGGIGKSNAIAFKFLGRALKLTTDPSIQSNLFQLVENGMIVSDTNEPKDIKFLQRWFQKLTGKEWFELRDSYIGKEKTVAVKDF